MLTHSLVIAQKEVLDGVRDVRSVISALLYALMGPAVIRLAGVHSGSNVAIAMMSVFTLVAAFVGGMNVAMDTIAGERERRSLVPLLLNPARRLDVAVGKWLAVSLFAIGGLAVNIAGFAGMEPAMDGRRAILPMLLGILPLAVLAASLQLLISTVCRAAKEAQTYLSLIVFLPMGAGMFLAFYPQAGRESLEVLPVAGQFLALQQMMNGKSLPLGHVLVLGCATLSLAALLLVLAANRLERDEIIYGN